MRTLALSFLIVVGAGSAYADRSAAVPAPAPAPQKSKSLADLLAASSPTDWRTLDPEQTIYLDLPRGRVVIELAEKLAPNHVANVKALAREHYFDGLSVMRAQDNYVAQWGDPDEKRQVKGAKKTLPPEFERPAEGLPFVPLPDPDTYAREVGLSEGFPVARDGKAGRAWGTHCYGMVGAGRDNDPASGGGTELYAVIGHAPRHLDRNVTLLGRVVWGIEHLSTLPRGTGALGFYEKPTERLPITAMRVAADVPVGERTELELLRTDAPIFAQVIESRRNRRDDWYKVPAGRIELCNVPLPVRLRARDKK